MTCYNPLPVFRTRLSTGDEYSFREPKKGSHVDRVEYPCGACVGCLKAHRQSWAMRITHESRYHDASAFLTLTYDDKHVPKGEIPYVHFQNFVRALRVSFGDSIRYFVAAEYGSRTGRPHFHAVLFGYYPSDCVAISGGASQLPLFSSGELLSLWSKGHVSVAPFSPATAGYVAGYVTKKVQLSNVSSREISRSRDGSRYVIDQVNHDLRRVSDLPEYHKASTRNGGLGFKWIMQNARDVLRDGFVVYSGNKVAIPRYYRKVLAKHWPDEYRAMCERREEYFAFADPHASSDRLLVRERIALDSSRVFNTRNL